MKKLFRRAAIAFSLYSRIPMPHFVWDEEDVGHAASFLPLTGLVIGLLEYASCRFAEYFEFPVTARMAVFTLIPLLVTGGFHVDGFMDTADAFSSYGSREEKLRILKDPHTGAFAVIRLAVIACLWILGLNLMFSGNRQVTEAAAAVFWEARACAGLAGVMMPHARQDGMLNMETVGSRKGTGSRGDRILLAAELAAGLLFMGMYDMKAAAVIFVSGAAFFLLYRKKMTEELGGVTGDTIGYLLVCTEVICIVMLGVYAYFVF